MKVYSRGSFIFSLILLLLLLTFICISLFYDFKSKLVPLIIMIPTAFLVIVILIMEIFPALASRFEMELFSASHSKTKTSEEKSAFGKKGFLITAVWLISFFLLIIFLGFIVAIPVCLIAYLKIYGHSWPRTLAVSVSTWVFIYVLFQVVIRFELFKGIFFGALV